MIVVTGGAGFIGSNLVRGLNARGRDDIIVVDDLSDGTKFVNLIECRIADYRDRDDFLADLLAGREPAGELEAVFHQGACSATTEWDGRYMLRNNHDYSKHLLAWCRRRAAPFIYASSAAVYGGGEVFREDPACEAPLNVYGWSKLLFDQYVRRLGDAAGVQVAGLRYFNVYGPCEQHKGSMASVAYHLHGQMRDGDVVRLFEGCDGYGDGEQRRDFVHVDDVVAVNLWLLDNPRVSGVFNVGTGASAAFNDVARAVIGAHQRGRIEYVPFPDHLRGRYQSFTEADISALRAVGYRADFVGVAEGVARYMAALGSGAVGGATS